MWGVQCTAHLIVAQFGCKYGPNIIWGLRLCTGTKSYFDIRSSFVWSSYFRLLYHPYIPMTEQYTIHFISSGAAI